MIAPESSFMSVFFGSFFAAELCYLSGSYQETFGEKEGDFLKLRIW